MIQLLALLALFTADHSAAQAAELVPDFLPAKYLPFDPKNLEDSREELAALEVHALRWSDIKAWRALGGRWAGGFDGSGKLLGIYDLGLSTLGPLASVKLGTLGGPGFHLKAVREAIANARPAGKSEKKQRAEALDRFDALGAEALERNLLPEGWQKQVPWKKEFLAHVVANGAAPPRFTLDDIDFTQATTNHALFSKALGWLARFGVEPRRLAFERTANGAYEMIYVAPAELRRDSYNEAEALKLGRPVLLADLKSIHSGFFQQVEWGIGRGVLGLAIGLIPIPVVSAIVGTAVSRFLTFVNDALWQHRQAASEMVTMAEEGGGSGAFAELSSNERKRVGMTLYLSSLSIFTIWKWVFKGAEKAWRANMADDLKRVGKARAWAEKHGEGLIEINARNAVVTKDGKPTHIYLLAYNPIFKNHRPAAAIEYEHPYSRFTARAAVEASVVAVSFASHFIPWVGGAVSTVYSVLVRNRFQYLKELESKLAAVLDERQRSLGENWSRELGLLDLQRVNPIEPTRARAEKLIARHRSDLGLPAP